MHYGKTYAIEKMPISPNLSIKTETHSYYTLRTQAPPSLELGLSSTFFPLLATAPLQCILIILIAFAWSFLATLQSV